MPKKEILLIMPKTGPVLFTPPFALMALAGAMPSDKRENVHIIDTRLPGSLNKIRKKIQPRDILMAGITSMTGPQIIHGIRVSRFIKNQLPEVPVVWGGIHPSYLPEQTVSEPEIDFVVAGHGDFTLPELEEALSGKRPVSAVKGLYYKQPGNNSILSNGNRSADELKHLASYAWDKVDPGDYIVRDLVRNRTISMFSSRGCPHQCTFCYAESFHHRRWIGQSAEMVLSEVDQVISRCSFDSIYFHDDNFAVNRKRLEDIAIGLKERNLYFGFALKLKYFDEELAAFLKEHNCDRIDWGAESGSNKVLKLYKKEQTSEDSINAAKLMRKYDLSGQVSTVVGHPDETEEDVAATLSLVDEMRRINPRLRIADIKILTPYPGSKFFQTAVGLGFEPPKRLKDWSHFYWNNPRLPWLKNRRRLEVISFTSLVVFFSWRLRKKNPVYNGLLFLFRNLEMIRWKKRFWWFAPEIRLMKKYLELINYSLRYR